MNKEKGNFGEAVAEKYLERKGLKVVKKNYFSRFGEIDIVASDENTLVFVEVKLRKKGSFCSGRESVNSSKIKKIIKTALKFISETSSDLNARFDVIEIQDMGRVSGGKSSNIVHLENAFSLDDVYRVA